MRRLIDPDSDHDYLLDGRYWIESAQSVQRTGKWIAIVAELGDHEIIVEGYNCSKCGRYDAEKDNFCPDCGAKMEVGG